MGTIFFTTKNCTTVQLQYKEEHLEVVRIFYIKYSVEKRISHNYICQYTGS